MRCATFMIGDEKGITPSNVDQGYVLRRLIRRATRFAGQLGIEEGKLSEISDAVIDKYGHAYPELVEKRSFVLDEINKEEIRFQKTIKQGLKEFDKVVFSGKIGEVYGPIKTQFGYHIIEILDRK